MGMFTLHPIVTESPGTYKRKGLTNRRPAEVKFHPDMRVGPMGTHLNNDSTGRAQRKCRMGRRQTKPQGQENSKTHAQMNQSLAEEGR